MRGPARIGSLRRFGPKPRPGGATSARARPHVWLAVVLLLLGFLVVVAVSTARVQRTNAEPRRNRLVKLIQDRRSAVEDLDSDVRALRKRVDQAEARVSRRGATERERAERIDDLSAIAGTTALEGPGVSVRMSDSIRQAATPQEAGAFRIHDVDIQLVANALFAAGAEAVSVNGNRLVATSPIRAAGGTIVVNFRPVTTPYEVRAIGARMDEFEKSEIARRFHRWQDLFGLGFRVERESHVVVPAFTGRVDLGTATPATVPPPPAAPS